MSQSTTEDCSLPPCLPKNPQPKESEIPNWDLDLNWGIPDRFKNINRLNWYTTAWSQGRCPEAYPYAFMHGLRCCASLEENVWKDMYAVTCDGGPLYIDSLCCKNNDDVKCTQGICSDYIQPTTDYIQPTTDYYHWDNWENGWVPDKK